MSDTRLRKSTIVKYMFSITQHCVKTLLLGLHCLIVYTNCLRAIIPKWHKASYGSRDDV